MASFIAALDLFIVNVGLPEIGKGVGSGDLSNLSWVLTAYAIIYAALLVPAGRLADRFGRKPGFMLGLGLFTAASLGAALSSDVWVLVFFRCLQAVGAAVLTPASLGLVLTSAPAHKVESYVKIWFTTGALAASSGPVIGGLLLELSWRWIFLVNLPIGIGSLLAAAAFVPDSREETDSPIPDLFGGLLLIVAIGAVALGIVQGPAWGWSSAKVIAAFAVGIVGGVAFVVRSLRHRAPVIRFELFRDGVFAAGNATIFLTLASFGISLLSVTLLMQDHWGYSPLKTGLAMVPGPAMVPVFAGLSEVAATRGKVPPGRIAAAGMALIALAGVLFALDTGVSPDYLTGFLPFWLILGAGVGLAMPTTVASSTVQLAPEETATGSAIVQMFQQIGSVVGISVLVAILGTASGAADLVDYQRGWIVSAALASVGALTALGLSRSVSTAPGLSPGTVEGGAPTTAPSSSS
jgi:EmrB/QacA subfamily drug resistance transporter